MDFDFGAHVDASRRLVHDQDLGLRSQPLGDDHLLLVAAGEEHGLLLQMGCPDVQPVHVILSRGAQTTPIHPSQPVVVAERGQDDVFQHRQLEDQPLRGPILGHKADTGFHRVDRRGDVHRLPIYEDLAGVFAVGAKDQAGRLGTASTHQPGKAQDLPPPQSKAHVVDHAPAGQSPHFEERLADLGGLLVEHVGQLATHHLLDDPIGRGLADQHTPYPLAIAQHHHPIGDAENLFQTVADKDDGNALLFECADDLE